MVSFSSLFTRLGLLSQRSSIVEDKKEEEEVVIAGLGEDATREAHQ